MRKKIPYFIVLAISFVCAIDACAYTILAEEVGVVFYDKKNGVEEVKPEKQARYEVDEGSKTVRRARLINLETQEVALDNTVYHIISDKDQKSLLLQEKMIYALGQPDPHSFELLAIGNSSILSSKATGDYIVISDMKILERGKAP